ncbi:methyltransferase-domain-containing protein [Zychaea mexicana]|uniref:methyltransferase-domain-containing protein n=1 Tax=Zychaea mexicana TaxID=64656 RepID=UPI0022FF091D|nr:methyltransferase-domain-containing protein [Zychaea mexicana]KAI9479595.1 methyltransferase-domain-containing protein [Zychaea mexicana]
MQPLFETSWALPSSIAPQKKTNKADRSSDQNRESNGQSVSKQADQLQNQVTKLNKNNNKGNDTKKQLQQRKKNNKKRQQQDQQGQNDNDTTQQQQQPPAKKAKLNNNNNNNNNNNGNNKKQIGKNDPMEEDSIPSVPKQQKQKQKEQVGKQKQSSIGGDAVQAKDAEETDAKPQEKLTKKQKKIANQQAKEAETASNVKPSVSKQNAAAAKKKPVTEDQKAKLQQLLAKKNESNDSRKSKQQHQKPGKKQTEKPSGANAPATTAKSNTGAKLTPLQQKMKEKLSGARFRWLNEQLYTTKGDESFKLFKEKPELFEEYHEGFRHQVESWPENPVDIFAKQLSKLPAGTVVADLGCGDAQIAHTLKKQKVLSFDMVAKNDKVVACDIANLPLPDGFVDVAVFSLALMGTNYLDFLKEAKRVLKAGGELKIAEVVSRFTDVDEFIALLEEMGFEFMDKMFIMLYFTKQEVDVDQEIDQEMLEGLSKAQKRALKKGAGVHVSQSKLQKKAEKLLKPCVYKKR